MADYRENHSWGYRAVLKAVGAMRIGVPNNLGRDAVKAIASPLFPASIGQGLGLMVQGQVAKQILAGAREEDDAFMAKLMNAPQYTGDTKELWLAEVARHANQTRSRSMLPKWPRFRSCTCAIRDVFHWTTCTGATLWVALVATPLPFWVGQPIPTSKTPLPGDENVPLLIRTKSNWLFLRIWLTTTSVTEIRALSSPGRAHEEHEGNSGIAPTTEPHPNPPALCRALPERNDPRNTKSHH